MTTFLSRLGRGIARLPRRILAAAGWAQMEPMGLGVGKPATGDLDEMETQNRQRRETWRQPEDKDPPAAT